jgi:TPR repeat protein/uncharacterized membrane protein YhaH (DUF805 family)
MKIHTYYDNLKVARTAPITVIKASYRALSQQHHPDKNGNSDGSIRIMKIINQAYEVLSNPTQRAIYDEELRQKEQQNSSTQTEYYQTKAPYQDPPKTKHTEASKQAFTATNWSFKEPTEISFTDFFFKILKIITWKGRTSPKEYWVFFTISTLIFIIFDVISDFTEYKNYFSNTIFKFISIVVVALCHLKLFLSDLRVSVRRLHDAGHSGWWLFFWLLFFFWSYFMVFSGEETKIPRANDSDYFDYFNYFFVWFPKIVIGLLPSTEGSNRYGKSIDKIPLKVDKFFIALCLLAAALTLITVNTKNINSSTTILLSSEKLAEQGDPDAQYKLGVMYADGQGVVKNEHTAVQWFQKAAEQNNASAQNALGYMYDNGRSVIKNERTAVEWYQKAADQGFANAQYNLGFMYANGRGVVKNERTAIQWFQKAADQGYAEAQYNLGIMYDNGRGVIKNERTAVEWYQKAADQGIAVAQNALGYMYDNGRSVIKNERTAVEWYKKAAEQGDAVAQNNLGLMYDNGRGVIKNERTAVQWYQKAAEQGYASAQNNLGIAYADGRGVVKNERTSVEWYKKAAEQGHASAQLLLGFNYLLGDGVVKNQRTAYFWFLLASANGVESAKKGIEIVEQELTPEQKQAAQDDAANWRPKQ